RLAAIMFTDIVGYTAMMQNNEEEAVRVINIHREVLEQITAKFGGKIINYYGDGSLTVFQSAIDAVGCAKEIQEIFHQEKNLPLRIGIHIGEVLFQEDNLFGDGVNIASRIESLGQPGTVLFSRHVFEKIRNHKEFQAVTLGTFEFKNVKEPMEVFALANKGFPIPKREEITGKLKVPSRTEQELAKSGSAKNWSLILKGLGILILLAISSYHFFNNNKNEQQNTASIEPYQSVTIFPFTYIGSDKDKSWLAEAMTEEVRRNVAQIPKISVTPGISSAAVYQQKDLDLQEMGAKLNVRYLVEGSLQVNNEEAQLNFSLTDVSTRDIMLIETINFQLEDLFSTQNETADMIAVKIRPLFVHPPGKSDAEKNVDPAAFEKYLEGKYSGNYESRENRYKESIQIDSNFALGYAGLAELYLNQAHQGYPGREVFPKSISYAEKSIALDSNSYIGLTALADCNYHYNYNWDLSEKYFKKVMSIDPSYAQTYVYFSGMLSAMNRHDEALYIIKKGQVIDPFHLYTLEWKIRSHYWARDLEMARKTFLELNSRNPRSSSSKWLYYFLFPDSNPVETLQKVVSENPNNFYLKVGLAIAYSSNNQLDLAEEIYNQLVPVLKSTAPSYLAKIDVHLGRFEDAIRMLELAYELKDASLIWINADASFDPIREDPRFQNLIEKMNLKNYPPY
ncbi:adenylate/guanylate cyclase domain-containing protein, partial [uncultured Eudoraea sp.]|uniref:adenylate/guanylate cyclase domain-containing protein n=1 Tax=uncultured Eudoraea sp. TaxID=1035614 RepID=UPI0026131B8C